MFKCSIRTHHLPVKVSMVQGGWMSVEVCFSWCFFLPGCCEKAVNVPWLSRGEWIQVVEVNELWEEKLEVSYHHWLRAHIGGETPALVVPIFKTRTHVISVLKWKYWGWCHSCSEKLAFLEAGFVTHWSWCRVQCWESSPLPGWGALGSQENGLCMVWAPWSLEINITV